MIRTLRRWLFMAAVIFMVAVGLVGRQQAIQGNKNFFSLIWAWGATAWDATLGNWLHMHISIH